MILISVFALSAAAWIALRHLVGAERNRRRIARDVDRDHRPLIAALQRIDQLVEALAASTRPCSLPSIIAAGAQAQLPRQ